MKKGMANILVLALVLINIVLSVVIIFTLIPASKKTSNLVDKICELVDLDLNGNKGEDKVNIEDLKFVDVVFASDTMNLAQEPGDKQHYAKIAVSIGLNTKHPDYAKKEPAVTSAMSSIASEIITLVGKHHFTETGLKETLQKEILATLKEQFDSDFIYTISIGQWVTQ